MGSNPIGDAISIFSQLPSKLANRYYYLGSSVRTKIVAVKLYRFLRQKMSKATENLVEAQKHAMGIRPKVGGFPVLAETLRLAGVTRNLWSLPSCQSIYLTKYGAVVQQGEPIITKIADVPKFNQEALIRTLRLDQAGESSFPQFLRSAWEAGVIGYDVDFERRTCTYLGAQGEIYVENYPAIDAKNCGSI